MALVTGAGGGIGSGVARALSLSGAIVVVADVDEAAAKVTSDQLLDSGGSSKSFGLDVSDAGAVERVVSTVESDVGPIDILVNVAGIGGTGHSAVEMEVDEWDRTFAVNARGVFLCSTVTARAMVSRRRGNIVTVASNTAQVLRMNQAAYASSKAASNYFTKALGLELAKFNIRCNVVNPGVTNSPMATVHWSDPRRREAQLTGDLDRFRVGIALGKLAEVEDIANAVVFLVSDQASHITTADLLVDGGSTLVV